MNQINNWNNFKTNKPFRTPPFSKRNWGHPNHSICSFYGKLKPSISHFLIDTFTNENDSVLDCFSGSGTIPFESALMNRMSYGIDINPIAVAITASKIGKIDKDQVEIELNLLDTFILNSKISEDVLNKAKVFGFNKKLVDYYEPETFKEIILAREYFSKIKSFNTSQNLIISCLLHILHGNRPYALSRNSHPITPYAPTGDYIYKNLIEKLRTKVNKSVDNAIADPIKKAGLVFETDILQDWDSRIQNINAIITSPPFFDSTKFYLTNWIRNWFTGWEFEDFEIEKLKFIDTLQKKSFEPYDRILLQCKERLSNNGIVLFHLGKSHKKDMGEAIMPYAKKYFNKIELYNEDVSDIEKHGVEDKGSVNVHQYLLMY
jgi:methylase of polypeptide subunit release factors